jgi:hypothetical protein
MKFGLFLLLLASVCTITEDEIYSYVVSLFKGMAETEEATCAGVLEKQKTRILEIVHEAIDEINAGTDTSTALQNALIKLMGVDGLVSECNVLAMPAIITKVTSKEGLVDIFQTCIDNIDDIYSFGEDIKAAFDAEDYNAAAEAFGHILSIAIDFQVNL